LDPRQHGLGYCEIADVDRTLASAISLIGYHTHELALATRRHDQKKERENRVFLNADTMIVSAYLEEVKDRKLTCEHFPRTAIAVAEDLEAPSSNPRSICWSKRLGPEATSNEAVV
jgi:hypothetical protein